MGLAERALAEWRKPQPMVREWPIGVGAVPPGAGEFGWRNTEFSPESYLDYVATSNEIFSAVMLRARLMSSLRLGLFRGDDADKTPMPDHPASRLLKHVNPFWTDRRLAMMDELCMGLMGQSFWAIEYTGTGRRRTPSEIWWMKPSRVLPKLDSQAYITGWLYEPMYGGPDLEFAADEVCWFRYPNPVDEFSPLSPLAAARLAADTATAMQKSNRDLFRQGLQIAGLIVPPADKVTFSQDQADELSDQLERRFAGADKRHRWAVLRYEAQFKQLSLSPKDAEFVSGLGLSLRQVCNAYGIPASLLNADSAELANVVAESTKILWAHTLVPDSQLRAAEVVEQFLPRFGPDAPDHAEYDYTKVAALQESATDTWLRDAQALDRGALTINEWRRRNGYPDVPWGDVYWAPVNKAPVTDATSNPSAEQGGGGDNEPRPPDDERNPSDQPESRLYDHHSSRRLIAEAFDRFHVPVRPVNGHRVLAR